MQILMPKKRRWRFLVYLVSIALILAAFDLVFIQLGRQITAGKDTTRINEPKMPNGTIDYLAAIETHFGQGVTPANNAVPIMLEALGRQMLEPTYPRDGVTTRLGMRRLPYVGDYYRERADYPRDDGLAETDTRDTSGDLTPVLKGPWKLADFPNTAAWLKANEQPLAKLIEASNRPRFFYPHNAGRRPRSLLEIPLPYVNLVGECASALVVRGLLRIEENNIDGAREDILAAHRIGALLTQGSTGVDLRVGYGIISGASLAEARIAASRRLDAAQLKKWTTAIAELPRRNSIAEIIDVTERFTVLDLLQTGAVEGVQTLLPLVDRKGWAQEYAFSAAPIRWEQAMKSANEWYDRAVTVAGKTDDERQAAIADFSRDLDQFSKEKKSLPQSLVSAEGIIPWFLSLKWADEQERYCDSRLALGQVAMAVAAYQAENGSYPATLNELKPAYLADLPNDAFTGKPLLYRPEGETFTLYSVGQDFKDNGGKPNPDHCGDGYDMVVSNAPAATTRASK